MSKKMKFTIEFEVPEDIEHFYGMQLHLCTLGNKESGWEDVKIFVGKKQRVRNGKHLHFDGDMCTVKDVGDLDKQESGQ